MNFSFTSLVFNSSRSSHLSWYFSIACRYVCSYVPNLLYSNNKFITLNRTTYNTNFTQISKGASYKIFIPKRSNRFVFAGLVGLLFCRAINTSLTVNCKDSQSIILISMSKIYLSKFHVPIVKIQFFLISETCNQDGWWDSSLSFSKVFVHTSSSDLLPFSSYLLRLSPVAFHI